MPNASIAWNLFDGLPTRQTPVTLGQLWGGGWGTPHGFGDLTDETSDGEASWGGVANYAGSAVANIAQGGSVVMSAPAMVGATVETASLLGSSWATAAIPIIGPVIAGVTVALGLWMARKGPKQKVSTTKVVNDIEPLLAENVQGYLNGPKTPAAYAQAIENFKAGWQYVLDNCGQPSEGEPGRRCIAERQRGARPQWDACRATGCPNWFELYLDPIESNPPSGGSAPQTPSILDSVFGGNGVGTGAGGQQIVQGVDNSLLLVGAAVLALIALS